MLTPEMEKLGEYLILVNSGESVTSSFRVCLVFFCFLFFLGGHLFPPEKQNKKKPISESLQVMILDKEGILTIA